jgi:hypothetical protein
LLAASEGKESVVVASDEPIYGAYSPAFLLQRANQLSPDIKSVVERNAVTDIPQTKRLICVNLDCSGLTGYNLVGERTIPVRWHWQGKAYETGLPKSRLLMIEVYDAE